MNISKRTAERMLQNIEQRLQALAAEQQAMNGNVGEQTMRKGGRVKMQDKGIVPNNWATEIGTTGPIASYGFNAMPKQQLPFFSPTWTTGKSLLQYQIPKPFDINAGTPIYKPDPSVVVSDANIAKFNNQITPTTPKPINVKGNTNSGVGNIGGMNSHLLELMPKFSTGLPTSNTLAGAPKMPNSVDSNFNMNNLLGMAPSIFNTIAGITSPGPDRLIAEQYQNPYESQAFSLMPDQFRVDDILNDNRNAYGSYLKNVNQVGNSRGERMANYGAGMNRMNDANTKAWALKNNMENEMRSNKAQLRNQQGMYRAQTNLKVRDMNDANAAAARNARMGYLGAAASGAQAYGLTQEQMANQAASQQAYINALAQMPHWQNWLGLKPTSNLGNGKMRKGGVVKKRKKC